METFRILGAKKFEIYSYRYIIIVEAHVKPVTIVLSGVNL